MKKILIVVGTRPNFIKITQLPRVLKEHSDKFEYKIVHTGQHYDKKMSDVFFQQFGVMPDIFLETKSTSLDDQMNSIQVELEKEMKKYDPDLVVVVGDVNSTAIAAQAAQKMNIKVAHIEGGLRSFDLSMPEEHNRIIADTISELFFVTEQSGVDNLIKEGKKKENIFFVGNRMIDTMIAFEEKIAQSDVLKKLDIEKEKFALMTMHRPATVDSKDGLNKLLELLLLVAEKYKIVFPIHPRTVKNLKNFGLFEKLSSNKNLILTEPLDYFSFQKLIKGCKFILTDSGGIQEESTYLKIPCITLRPNTERPSTVILGTNELMPFDLYLIQKTIADIEVGKFKKGTIPPFWDGKATERIVNILLEKL